MIYTGFMANTYDLNLYRQGVRGASNAKYFVVEANSSVRSHEGFDFVERFDGISANQAAELISAAERHNGNEEELLEKIAML